jgi:hypothetical protein
MISAFRYRILYSQPESCSLLAILSLVFVFA